MNTETMRIQSKGRFLGGIQDKNEKNRTSLKSLRTDNRSEKSKYKPLLGKIFYLDLPSITVSEKLQKDIKDLGGRVEEFLSKDISYLISNKKEAKYAQTLSRISPVPSPESAYTVETTSPHPSHDGSSFKSPDTVCLSRGKLLVEKAIKDHDFIPSNSILSNALSWGVKILHIDDIRYYIEQKKKELNLLKKSSTSVRDTVCISFILKLLLKSDREKVGIGIQKARTGRLKKPFLKVEDVNQFYRPFYLQLTSMPFINYFTQKPCSPFDVDKTSSIQKQTQAKLRIHTDGGIPVQLQLKEKRKKGYCECCLQKYEDLETHLLSEKHKIFAQSNQYQVVDDIVSKLVFDFVEYERDTPKKKRIKYSAGSLSPVSSNFLKKTEPKEKLQLHPDSQKDLRENKGWVTKQNFLHEETQESEPKLELVSEHNSCPSGELRVVDERTIGTFSAAEEDVKQNSTQLPPQKSKQECGHDLSEHELIINENYIKQRVNESPSMPQSCVQMSYFSTDDSPSQPKLASDTAPFPALKDLKEKDLHSVFDHDSDLITINMAEEHLTVNAKTQSYGPQEPNECDTKAMNNLPSGKIHRKVRILLGRNREENLEPNAELDKKALTFLLHKKTEFIAHQYSLYWTYFRQVGRNRNFWVLQVTLKTVVYVMF